MLELTEAQSEGLVGYKASFSAMSKCIKPTRLKPTQLPHHSRKQRRGAVRPSLHRVEIDHQPKGHRLIEWDIANPNSLRELGALLPRAGRDLQDRRRRLLGRPLPCSRDKDIWPPIGPCQPTRQSTANASDFYIEGDRQCVNRNQEEPAKPTPALAARWPDLV